MFITKLKIGCATNTLALEQVFDNVWEGCCIASLNNVDSNESPAGKVTAKRTQLIMNDTEDCSENKH